MVVIWVVLLMMVRVVARVVVGENSVEVEEVGVGRLGWLMRWCEPIM